MNIDEWDRLKELRVGHKEFQRTTEAIPACLACHRAATHWPCNIQDGTGPFADAIHHIHSQILAAQTQPAPAQPSAANQTAAPNTPTEPAASTATPRPSPAPAKPKPSERREPG